ncbi:MAG: murein hydrolase activator EnvC family protein [Sandaracinaceae bacterium]
MGRRHAAALALALAACLVALVASADPPAPGAPDALLGAGPEGCDASAGQEALSPGRRPGTPVPPDAKLHPFRFREGAGLECQRHRGRRMCDGPRRVPEPWGEPAALARALGIDEHTAGRRALREPAPRAWVEAVRGAEGEGLLWPVPEGRLWRGFGHHREILQRRGRLRRGRRRVPHPGLDIGAEEGSAVVAANDGLVVYAFNGLRGYGNAAVLLHVDGTVTLYAHNRAVWVFAGQQVRRGQVIAEVGHTGLAYGDHLHFEWRFAGQPVDPLPHLVDRPDPGDRRAPEEAGGARD